MGLWEAAFLGLIQGLTEFLPISSSAHIRIIGEFTGGGDPGAAFTAIIQIGTELAVVLYFRRDIARILAAWWRALTGAYGRGWRPRVGLGASRGAPAVSHDAMMGWFIIVGTIPIVVLGLAFQDHIESTFRNLWWTVLMLSAFALLLGWADKVRPQERTLEKLSVRHALFFGLWQALALIPGVSRSGGTITGGRLMGYTREAAARYSFLLALPAVFGAGFLQLYKSLDSFGTPGTPGVGAMLVGTLISFVVGYVVIIAFLKIVSTYSYMPFVWYRLGLAALVAVLLLTGVLSPTPSLADVPAG
ncbi:MAG: undecaprenyl-diphosphate phosphatase [Micrococcales bacterium]|nr:undecaprenyl-diphosphate phosphatase [Micrococcales bacterium]